MKFSKYNSIENVSRSKTINEIITQGHSGGDWVVTEKVHGANFSLWFDGSTFTMGKRSGFIGSDNFYGVWETGFHNTLEEYAKDVWNFVKKYYIGSNIEVDTITIYGELYGGNYPHTGVGGKNSNTKAVQKGVWYRPDLGFYAFDLMINENLSYDDLMRGVFTEYNIPHGKILFRGSFEEAIRYDNTFQTTIPESLGLPTLENNIAEGVVIKPIKPAFFHSGSRVILKSKSAKFTEKEGGKTGKVKEAIILEGKPKLFYEEMSSYVNDARLASTISKLGKITNKDFGKIVTAFWLDVLEEFNKDFSFTDIDTKQRKLIQKMISTKISLVIRPEFRNIIDRF